MVSGKPMEENQWTAKEKEISMSHKCIHSKIFSVNLLFFMLKKKKLFQQTSSQVIQLEEVQVGKKGYRISTNLCMYNNQTINADKNITDN